MAHQVLLRHSTRAHHRPNNASTVTVKRQDAISGKIMFANDEILKARDAADLLGAHIETIRRMARKGDLPAFKVGKDWRFRKASLMKWIDQKSNLNKMPRLLVVDDERVVCKTIQRMLEPEGYILDSAQDGIRGIELFQRNGVDLVLLDLNMPDMSGVDFLKHFRKMDANVPVIIITGYPQSDLMYEAMQYGPLILLPKPIGKQQLLNAVAAVIKGKAQPHG